MKQFKFNYGIFRGTSEETWSLATGEISDAQLKILTTHIKEGDHSGLTANMPQSVLDVILDAARNDAASLDNDMTYSSPEYEMVPTAYIPIELIHLLPKNVQELLPQEALNQPLPKENDEE